MLVVENAVMLAPVAVRSITLKHKQRFRQYLALFDLELGLIANFHSTSLEIEKSKPSGYGAELEQDLNQHPHRARRRPAICRREITSPQHSLNPNIRCHIH